MSILCGRKEIRPFPELLTALPMQPYLPQLLHGYGNMESNIIALYQLKWPIPKIAGLYNITPAVATKILIKYGYLPLCHPRESGDLRGKE